MAITRDILSGYLAKSGGMVESVDGPVHKVTNIYASDRDVLAEKKNEDKAATPVKVSHYGYPVNALGQRTHQLMVGSQFGAGFTRTFGYDAKGQVTKDDHSTNNTFDRQYAFDGIGNRTTATENTTTVNYTANSKNQYSSVGGSSYTYDADGNLTDDGTYKYIYDAENRLIKTTNQSNVTLGLYYYDYLSRRYLKNKQGSGSWYTIYDGRNLIAEYTVQTSSIVLNKTFTWGKDLSGSMQGAGGVGGLLSIKQGLTSYYPTYDGNGNISEYIQSTDGSVVAHYEYDAFGRSLVVSGSKAGWFGFRFSTKRINTECGLYCYGYRYYAPETGRWINRDPIQERGGLNLYGFVDNDGVYSIDALGLVAAAPLAPLAGTPLGGAAITGGSMLGAGVLLGLAVSQPYAGFAPPQPYGPAIRPIPGTRPVNPGYRPRPRYEPYRPPSPKSGPNYPPPVGPKGGEGTGTDTGTDKECNRPDACICRFAGEQTVGAGYMCVYECKDMNGRI